MEKIKCNCTCHKNREIKHIVPCCKNGFIEIPDLPSINEIYEKAGVDVNDDTTLQTQFDKLDSIRKLNQ